MTNTDTDPAERGPSPYYDGCFTVAAVDATYRERFAAMMELDLDEVARRPVRDVIQEDHRRAHVRLTGRLPRTGTTRRRTAAAPVVLQPTEAEDGALVITCQGACGETKPARKFPTRSGGRPGREAICRDCRDAAKAAKRNGA